MTAITLIVDAFHVHWLRTDPAGIVRFHAPEFYLTQGVASFINGRHRTLVLANHRAEIPMALTNMDLFPLMGAGPSQESFAVLQRLSVRTLDTDETVELPDLPVKYLGFDLNIGK